MALDELIVRIKATTEGLEAGLEKAGKQLEKFDATAQSKLIGATKALGALGVAAAAAGAALAIHLVSHALESAAALDNMSKMLGISVEELAKLHYAASRVGVSTEGVNMAIRRMGISLEAAESYTGPAAEALRDLGVEIKDIRDLKPDEQFKILADAIGKARDQSEKMRISTQLFGREGGKMVALFNEGREGIEKYGQRAEALGLVLSTLEVEKLHEAEEALNEMEKLAQGFGNRLAVEVAPVIIMVAKQVTDWAAETHAVQKVTDALVETYWFLAKAVGYVMVVSKATLLGMESMLLDATAAVLDLASDVQYGFENMWSTIKSIATAITATFNVVWQGIKVGVDGIKLAWGVMAEEIGAIWAKTLFTIAEGMRTAGLKGADVVETAALRVGAATGDLSAKYTKELDDQVAATKVAAEEMANAWKDVGAGRGERGENATDRAASSLREKSAGVDAQLNSTLQQDPGQHIDDLRKQMDQEQDLKDKAQKREEGSKQKHLNIMEKQDQQAGARLKALWEAGYRGRLQMAADVLGQLSSLMDTHSRKAFEIGKAAALAEAVIKGYQAAVSAWAAGMSVGGPYAPAVAAAYTAASLVSTGAQIAKISSMSFGGGSSGGGGGGGGGDTSAASIATGAADTGVAKDTRTGVILHMPDDALMDGQGFRRLIKKLNETTADGAQLGKITIR